MQYLGGKTRIATEIVRAMNPSGIWWEPFCGGLSVSVQLAKYGPGLVTDANKALIATYLAVASGWDPPRSVSLEEYHSAKTLPDEDPRKAFIGFGASFGGKWFGGYHPPGVPPKNQDFVRASRSAVLRDVQALRGCLFGTMSFLDNPPSSGDHPDFIYADPPYAGTTQYAGVPPFDTSKFWSVCQAWARKIPVFVSEYACPIPHVVVWEKPHCLRISGVGQVNEARMEKLFRVLP